ncbi:MAG: hypothetical protein AAF514_12745, partial [Verrucomicrobiota bacterium]
VEWAYTKSASGSAGEDRFWLDDLEYVPFDYAGWESVTFEGPYYQYPQGDADGDGLTNLFEFAFAGMAFEPSFELLQEPGSSAPSASIFRFDVDPRKQGLTYAVEISFDLENWLPFAASVVDQTATRETLELVVPEKVTRTFVRLRVNEDR